MYSTVRMNRFEFKDTWNKFLIINVSPQGNNLSGNKCKFKSGRNVKRFQSFFVK